MPPVLHGTGTDLREFIAASRIINYNHPAVRRKARDLAGPSPVDDRAVAERCFLFVRDEIRHSADFRLNPVTLKASEVLEHRTGFCYAKSHLLCALLRANGIPAGLCYQRLASDSIGQPFGLHGLTAIYLPDHGWYRVDARGNKTGVDARFTPPAEHLAYRPGKAGEGEISGIFAEPLAEVVEVLGRSTSFEDVLAHPPDRLLEKT
ncbi:MAG: transglutaminase domain-containing protein [Methanomicrobiales archaeon]|nr:transglutaminase domain-containing protein [Methanomicrobiales archaeon]